MLRIHRPLIATIAIVAAATGCTSATGGSAVTPEEREANKAPQDILELLRQEVPGAFISPSGAIRLRQWESPIAGNDALLVIDGIPQEDNSTLFTLRPSDVAEVTVVKNSAAARYGLRGANGVVEITTKGSRQ